MVNSTDQENPISPKNVRMLDDDSDEEDARASNNHFRLQTAQVGSQTSDNALQNHFNVIITVIY